MWEVFNYRTGELVAHTDSVYRARRMARRGEMDYALAGSAFGGPCDVPGSVIADYYRRTPVAAW